MNNQFLKLFRDANATGGGGNEDEGSMDYHLRPVYSRAEMDKVKKENDSLQKELEQEQFNHTNTRIAWDATTEDRDNWKAQAKALSAIKKGLETSYSDLQKENERLREALELISKLKWSQAHEMIEIANEALKTKSNG